MAGSGGWVQRHDGALRWCLSAEGADLGEVVGEDAVSAPDPGAGELRRVLRVQVAGLDMARYTRFSMLTPDVGMEFGGKLCAVYRDGQYHYSTENYDPGGDRAGRC